MVIAGVEYEAHYIAFDLPHSDNCFVVAFPAETTQAFLEAQVRAFACFGGVPTRILYDNTKLGGTGPGRRRMAEDQGLLRAAESISCSRRSSADRPRVTTTARLRAWGAIHGVTLWSDSTRSKLRGAERPPRSRLP